MPTLLFSGCSTNDNCPGSHPICGHGGSEHLCGCNANEDCQTGEICDTGDLDGDGDNKECIPDGCNNDNTKCEGFDAICNIPNHDNCFYCNGEDCVIGTAISFFVFFWEKLDVSRNIC